MKLKSTLAVGVLMSALVSIEARADCTLEIQPSSYIPLGQTFSFFVKLYDFGPPTPFHDFTLVFFGTKNGVADIPPTGEAYPGIFHLADYSLNGFQNPPQGGLSGNYTRYLVAFDQNGHVFCVSNTITATLQ
jgi:hypothetical protein